MSFSIPFEELEIESQENIFSIKSANKSALIAFLSQQTLFIRDSSKYGCPIVSQYTRSEESQHEYGPNYWVQWIEKKYIAWGTCSGAIFFSNLDEDNKIQEPLTVNLDMAITATFSAYGYLAICQNNSIVQFVKPNGEKFSTLNFEKGISRFKSVRFVYPNMLSCILGGSPVVAFLKKSAIEEKAPFLFCFEKEKNAVISAYSQKRSLLAFALDDHSVKVISVGSPDGKRYDILQKSDVEIVKMEWILNGLVLLVIYSTGRCACFYSETGDLFFVTCPQLQNAIDIELDPFMQQIFYTNFKETGCILISESNKDILFTPVALYDPFSNKKLFSIPENIPNELFPIRLAEKLQNTYVVANTSGFIVINNDKISDLINLPIKNIKLSDNYLFAFTLKEIDFYEITIFDHEGNQLTKLLINNIPIQVSAHKDKVIVSSTMKYTTLSVSTDLTVPVKIGDGHTLVVENFTPSEKLQNAIFSGDDSVILHYSDGTCVQLPEDNFCTSSAKYIFNAKHHNVCIIQQAMDLIMTFNGKLFSFENTAFFVDDNSIYYCFREQKFGKIQTTSKMYIPYILNYSLDPDLFKSFLDYFRGKPRYTNIFSESLKISRVLNHMTEFVGLINTMRDGEMSVVIYDAFKQLMPDDKKLLQQMQEVKWNVVLKKLPPEAIGYIFMVTATDIFNDFVEKNLPLKEPERIIAYLSTFGAFVPAMIIADLSKVQFIHNFTCKSLSNLMKGFKVDKNRWPKETFDACAKRAINEGKEENNCAVVYVALALSEDPSADDYAKAHPELLLSLQQNDTPKEKKVKE